MVQAVESVSSVLAHLEYRGIFSAEFKRDPRDGLFKLLEINARPWWYIEYAERCGVDVCTMAYRDALGEPVPDVRDFKVGARFVYSYHDYFACREAWRAGEVTLAQWAGSWIGAQQPLFNWTDPWPALVEAWTPLGGRVTRGLRRRSRA
jgi:predicted ATP-grasp superfamily ATP-dependent carboligase